jgi:hypothetical protein
MSFKVTRQQPFEGLIGAFANTTDPNRTKHRLNIEKSDFPMLDFQNAFSMPLRNSKNRNQEWAKTHLEFDGEQDFMRYCLFLFIFQFLNDKIYNYTKQSHLALGKIGVFNLKIAQEPCPLS